MTRKLVILFACVFSISLVSHAHEGMWLLHMLKKMNEAEMKNLGLNLSAEDIYDINNACVKDAIVMLNGGMCTAEVISGKGLVLTNHHCSYGSIQSLSTVENDYLTNGFWAGNYGEELPIEGFEVSFLQRIEDVSERVLKDVTDDMDEATRSATLAGVMKEIEEEASEEGKFRTQVKSFFHGNEFYLMVYRDYMDVRLVGTPPEAIGKYGGDTDNWMWPRHTGDFSMLRIYADSDNNPAEYSEDNQPYEPKHHLPVSLDGVEAGDFTMIMGYPGSTDRYLSSFGVKQAIDIHNPSVVEVRDMKLKTMKEHMNADAAVRLQYASKYASTANYWKYYIGQTKGLKRLNVYDKKQKIEADYLKWAKADPKREAKYAGAIQMMEDYYAATDATEKGNVYALEAGLIGADLPLFAFRFARAWGGAQAAANAVREENAAYKAAMDKWTAKRDKLVAKGKEDKVKPFAWTETDAELKAKADALAGFMETAEGFFKDYDMATDKDVYAAVTQMYMDNIDPSQQPSILSEIQTSYGGSAAKFAEAMYASSVLANKDKFMAFMKRPLDATYESDLAIAVGSSYIAKYRESFANPAQEKYDVGYRLFVDGLRQMNADKNYYPDANSTMRLTYGVVGDYYPADAVHYDFVTTASGILEKKDNSNPEFVVDDNLDRLIRAKDFGQYADDNGELVVCFISNNDITGGNSGSPVINGDGALIGLAFDGNWEAMSGDIAFEDELQRTISVDIRYVMWVVDVYAGAKNIIDEIDFVKAAPATEVAPADEAKASK